MQFLGDHLLVEVEEMRAFPRLHQRAAEQPMQRRTRDRSPAETRNRRMYMRRAGDIAQRQIDVQGELAAHADGETLFDHDDVLAPTRTLRNCSTGNGRNATSVTRPIRNPSARISSIVSLMVPLTEPMAMTSISASSAL